MLSLEEIAFCASEFHRLLCGVFHLEVKLKESTAAKHSAELRIGRTLFSWVYEAAGARPALFTIQGHEQLDNGESKAVFCAHIGIATPGFYAASNATPAFGQLVVDSAGQLSEDVRSFIAALKQAETDNAPSCEPAIVAWFQSRLDRFPYARMLP